METRYEHLSVAELERESNLYVHRYRNNGGRSEFDLATQTILDLHHQMSGNPDGAAEKKQPSKPKNGETK